MRWCSPAMQSYVFDIEDGQKPAEKHELELATFQDARVEGARPTRGADRPRAEAFSEHRVSSGDRARRGSIRSVLCSSCRSRCDVSDGLVTRHEEPESVTRNKPGRPSHHDTQTGDQTDREIGKPPSSDKPDPDDGKPGRAGTIEREDRKQ